MSKPCPSVKELVGYLNEKPFIDREIVETHLRDCSMCNSAIAQLTDESGFGEILPSLQPAFNTDDKDLPAVLNRIKRSRDWQQPLPEIDGYELSGVIGRGASAIVYRAQQFTPRRQVAIKMLLKVHQTDEKTLARFKSEADLVARLAHPSIAPIFEVGQHQGLAFFTMPFFEGGSLSQRLDGTPIPSSTAARMIRDVAAAIQEAHRQNVVHRDLKPENILLKYSQTDDLSSAQPVISDFGVAKSLQDESGLTQTGELVGTAYYMAPEQVQGSNEAVSSTADIYAIGAVLYELITGRPPFRAESSTETLLQVLHHDPISPRQLQPGLSRDIETICLHCLAKNPDHRYQSATQLASDLDNFLSGQPITVRPIGPVRKIGKWIRRRPTSAALAAACAVATLALLGVWLGFTFQLRDQRDTISSTAAELEKEQQQTERSFQRAHKAIRNYLITVQVNQQLNQYEMLPLKKELLTSGASFYEDFLRENLDNIENPGLLSASTTVDLEQARLFLNLGRLHFETRDYRESLQSMQLAQRISITSLPGDSIFENTEFATLLGVIYMSIAKVQLALDLTSDAITAAEESRTIFRELGNRGALSPGYQNWYLAEAQQRLAAAFFQAEDLDQAFAASDQAVTHSELLTGIYDFQHTQSVSYLLRGRILRALEKTSQSLNDLRAAVDVIEKVTLKSQPKNKRYEGQLSSCLTELARHHDLENQPDDAIVIMQKAIDCQIGIYRMHPTMEYAGYRLADMYDELARLQTENSSGLSEIAFARAKIIRSQLDRQKNGPSGITEQIRNCIDLADAFVRQEKLEDSAEHYFKALGQIDQQRVVSDANAHERLLKEVHFKLSMVLFELARHTECIQSFETLIKMNNRLDAQNLTKYAVCLAVAGETDRALQLVSDVSVIIPSANGSVGLLPLVFFLAALEHPESAEIHFKKGTRLLREIVDQLDLLTVTQRLELVFGLCWSASLCDNQSEVVDSLEGYVAWADKTAVQCLVDLDSQFDSIPKGRRLQDKRLDRLLTNVQFANLRARVALTNATNQP